jgi:tryptophanyl-tRNA synthetase
MKVVSAPDVLQHFMDAYANCTIRYGELKKQLAEDMVNFLTPLRLRIKDIKNDDNLLAKIAKMGAEKAADSAEKTMKEVRAAIGFKKLY